MIRLSAILAVLLSVSGPSRDDSSSTRFCPECWRFAPEEGEWSMDEAGRCWTCGKPPVAIETAILQWSWCSRQGAWLRKSCPESARESCCVTNIAQAVLVRPDERVERARYCPECASFDSADSVPIRCILCGRPSAKAESVTRAWTWCRTRRAWREAACESNAVDACCIERSGRLLAFRPK
jgi:hypothetical protein